MISKEKFVEIIDKLRKVNDFVNEVNDKAREIREQVNNDWFDGNNLFISHENTVIELLESIFNDTEDISWWVYELDYGRKYQDGCIKDGQGNNIDLSTSEKLYDYLIKNGEN